LKNQILLLCITACRCRGQRKIGNKKAAPHWLLNGFAFMNLKAWYRGIGISIAFTAILVGCAGAGSYSPLLNVEPAVGSVLKRPPRTLRLFFNALPDVTRSSLTLQGPDGEYTLIGLHTMAADDLMVEIENPSIPDGDYVVQWTTVVGNDPEEYSGSIQFSVQRE